jgi:serine acetyltransferase
MSRVPLIGNLAALYRRWPNTRIGAVSLLGTNSVVRGDIPDRSTAVGAPALVAGGKLRPGTPQ